MNRLSTDRDTFIQNLRISKLLTNQQFRVVVDRLSQVHSPREIAKALVSWKLVTKFQAQMILKGRNTGFFLGPYKILEQLGQGGMGRVYKAMHQTMNRVVALKVLAPQVVTSERAHKLFLREVQAAAQLNHPNIVLAYDANEIEGRHYLAMEFVDGPNLERYVRKHGPLPAGLACEIIFQAANGLQHATEKRMVHRDIKPANLLIQENKEENTVQVKILDFGLAHLHEAENAIVTRENTVMGTPDFLSPEQSRDLHSADVRSDLYSLGCTFYYLLTGEVPFPGGTTVEKVARHNNDMPRPIEEFRPDVPAKVVSIVRQLMAKRPDDRYQTPDELMDALAPYASATASDWPLAAPSSTLGSSNDELMALPEPQVDTEPKAQSSTHISDEESILEWVGEQSKQRRFMRRAMIAGVIVLGLLALGGAGLAGWWFAS